jgi:hypothetical protein
MNLKVRMIVGVLVALMCFLSISAVNLPFAFESSQTIVRVLPQEMVLGSPSLEDVTNTTFTIAVVIENVTDLYGFDAQFGWNTTYLKYVGHTSTVPVEDYPYPIPPSPYAGILHGDTMKLKDVVNENGIPLAQPETMAWIGYSLAGPAWTFDGNGTVFIMSFRVKYQPYICDLPANADHVNLHLSFILTDLASPTGPIPHTPIDGTVKLYARRCPSPYDLNNDGITNLYDIVIVADAYGSHVGDPEWNQLADIAPQWGKIDIYDAVTIVYHYGETNP